MSTTETKVVPFSFDGSEVRTTEGPDGKPWYCAKDVCAILNHTNSRKAVADHCRKAGVTKRYTSNSSGEQEMLFVSEPNLYRLICHSRLPAAEKFEEWVFEVLIPAAMRAVGAVPQPETAPFLNKYVALLEDNHSTAKAEIARLHREIRSLLAHMPCTPEEVDTFMFLRNAGYSINKIARTTKRNRHTVRRHLAEGDAQDIDEQIREMTDGADGRVYE